MSPSGDNPCRVGSAAIGPQTRRSPLSPEGQPHGRRLPPAMSLTLKSPTSPMRHGRSYLKFLLCESRHSSVNAFNYNALSSQNLWTLWGKKDTETERIGIRNRIGDMELRDGTPQKASKASYSQLRSPLSTACLATHGLSYHPDQEH